MPWQFHIWDNFRERKGKSNLTSHHHQPQTLTCDSEGGGGRAGELSSIVRYNPQMVLSYLLTIQDCRGGEDTSGGVQVEVEARHSHL